MYMLTQHGLSDDEIKELKKEEDRVNAILELQKSQNKIYHPPKSVKKYTDLKNSTTKKEQEDMLEKIGYSESEIKSLKYEDDRVKAILDHKKGKKKVVKKEKSEWEKAEDKEKAMWKEAEEKETEMWDKINAVQWK